LELSIDGPMPMEYSDFVTVRLLLTCSPTLLYYLFDIDESVPASIISYTQIVVTFKSGMQRKGCQCAVALLG
jgi:hypothetical protein